MTIKAGVRNTDWDAQAPLERVEAGPGTATSPEEWFVLSRVEPGITTVGLARVCGLPVEQVRAVVGRLHAAGLVRRARSQRPAAPGPQAPGLDPALGAALRRLEAGLDQLTHYEVLGIAVEADPRAIKAAWLAETRRFHPDRHYGVALGEDGARLARVVRRLRSAYETLSDPETRAAYDRRLGLGGAPAGETSRPPSGPARESARRRFVRDRFGAGPQRVGRSRAYAAEAQATEEAGHLEEAVRLWTLAASLDVGNPAYTARAEALRARLEEGEARRLQATAARAEAAGRLEEAERHLCAAAKASPRCAHCHLTLARFLLRSGGAQRSQQALSAARRATQLQPSDPEVWRGLAEVLAGLGRPAEAREALARVGAMEGTGRLPKHRGESPR